MFRPRDENLRLIGAEEEAHHIDRHLRGAALTAAFCLLSAAVGVAVFYVVGAQGEWLELSVASRDTLRIWAALACSLSFFLCIFYCARAVRYTWYRRQHRAFLRKYNRL